MRLNAPKKVTWIVAVILGVVGVLTYFVPLAFLSFITPLISVLLITLAFVLLALATFLKGF